MLTVQVASCRRAVEGLIFLVSIPTVSDLLFAGAASTWITAWSKSWSRSLSPSAWRKQNSSHLVRVNAWQSISIRKSSPWMSKKHFYSNLSSKQVRLALFSVNFILFHASHSLYSGKQPDICMQENIRIWQSFYQSLKNNFPSRFSPCNVINSS